MQTISQWLAVACGLAWFSLHVDDVPTPSHHVELALNTDDTAATAMSCQLVLLVSCLETLQWPRMVDERMEDSHQHLEENCDALSQRSVGTSASPDQYNSLGNQSTGSTARCLGVTLVTWLTWSHWIDQIWNKAAQRLGVLGPILHTRSGLSIRNGVQLYN